MSDQKVSRVEVSIGDVHGSQLIVGDHNTIQTPEGTEVTVLQVGEHPVPRLRPMPISRRPSAVEIVGREEELDLIVSSSSGSAVQLYAESGAGKTVLLKFVGGNASTPAEGVVFETARRRSLDEIQAGLYAAFWQCDVPFIPDPAQIGDFLVDREALLILDDCCLDRDDLETLLDRLPRCSVVLASEARTLWSRGTAQRLGELGSAAAVQLLERELGRVLDPGEQAAAEAIVARLGGKPQALVETAALVEDGPSSLNELADDPAALERRTDPSALTDSQKRILQVLSRLDGAALGVEHISALAGLPDSEGTLRQLERRGWVKAGSPRYRSLRHLPPGAFAPAEIDATQQMLGYLTAWSGEVGPQAVAGEAEAIERALELGVTAGRGGEALALSLAAERGLFVAGAWSSCQKVLRIGLRAAELANDQGARAYLMHQLGSLSLCLGDSGGAVALLGEALQIREALGEHQGAELTRHNLRQLGGGRGANGDGGGGSGGPPTWMLIALVALALVAIGFGGTLALGGGDDGKIESSYPTTSTGKVPPGEPPTIAVESPREDATFEEDEESSPDAEFTCTAAQDARLESCHGDIDGAPIANGDSLVLTAGEHTLRVTAVDDYGLESTEKVSYEVASSESHQVDEPPVIEISSPIEEEQFVPGQSVTFTYTCTDDIDGSGIPCEAPVPTGESTVVKSIGPQTFTVTAEDSTGHKASKSVDYEVVEPTPPEPTPEEPSTLEPTTPEPAPEPFREPK
jgi:hypothetical protein